MHTQVGELQPLAFWKTPFKAAMSRSALVEFVILDLERSGPAFTDGEQRQRRGRTAWALADVTVARRVDFGANDTRMSAVTHLGNLLKVGDYVWGYMVAAAALDCDLSREDEARLPEVMLVKKSYSDRKGKSRRRLWRLRQLDKETEAGVIRGRHMDYSAQEDEYEDFMQELEEDPTLRKEVHMYRDEDAIEAEAAAVELKRAARAGAHAGAADAAIQEEEDDDYDEDFDESDFPQVRLDELLDGLTIGDGAAGGEGAASSAAGALPAAPVVFAAPADAGQFALPEGNVNAKFFF